MKKIILFTALFITTLFASCKDDAITYDFEGQITEPNPMACPELCCGGWLIDIEGEMYHFLDLPTDSELSFGDIDSYPFSVKLNYEVSEDCWDFSINILEIEAL